MRFKDDLKYHSFSANATVDRINEWCDASYDQINHPLIGRAPNPESEAVAGYG